MFYETAHLTYRQAKEFCRKFDSEVGTERELNNVDLNTYYVLCVDLEPVDISACRKIELASLGVGE